MNKVGRIETECREFSEYSKQVHPEDDDEDGDDDDDDDNDDDQNEGNDEEGNDDEGPEGGHEGEQSDEVSDADR